MNRLIDFLIDLLNIWWPWRPRDNPADRPIVGEAPMDRELRIAGRILYIVLIAIVLGVSIWYHYQ